jgi:hypothetical protein
MRSRRFSRTFRRFYRVDDRKQPNPETWQKQLDAWVDLVLGHARHYRMYTLDVPASLSLPPFTNAVINRRAKLELATAVVDELVRRGSAEYVDSTRKRLFLWWITPDDWATVLDDFVRPE